jgi:hypothetical protein
VGAGTGGSGSGSTWKPPVYATNTANDPANSPFTPPSLNTDVPPLGATPPLSSNGLSGIPAGSGGSGLNSDPSAISPNDYGTIGGTGNGPGSTISELGSTVGGGSGGGLNSTAIGPSGSAGAGGGIGGAGASAGSGAAGGAAGGTGGMPFMPMGGMGGAPGGGQGKSEDRERTTWLMEDRDIWGGDQDIAPRVVRSGDVGEVYESFIEETPVEEETYAPLQAPSEDSGETTRQATAH